VIEVTLRTTKVLCELYLLQTSYAIDFLLFSSLTVKIIYWLFRNARQLAAWWCCGTATTSRLRGHREKATVRSFPR